MIFRISIFWMENYEENVNLEYQMKLILFFAFVLPVECYIMVQFRSLFAFDKIILISSPFLCLVNEVLLITQKINEQTLDKIQI